MNIEQNIVDLILFSKNIIKHDEHEFSKMNLKLNPVTLKARLTSFHIH